MNVGNWQNATNSKVHKFVPPEGVHWQSHFTASVGAAWVGQTQDIWQLQDLTGPGSVTAPQMHGCGRVYKPGFLGVVLHGPQKPCLR